MHAHAPTDSTLVEQTCVRCCKAGVGVLTPPDRYTERFCPACRGDEGNLVDLTGVPAIFALGLDRFRIHDATDDKIVKALRDLMNSRSDLPMVGIIGSHGRGKSRALAAWIVEARRLTHRPALFRTWTRIHLELLDTYKEGSQRRTIEVIDLYSRVPFLALDDVGSDTDSEHSTSRLFDILNERLNANLPTAFSSNYTLNELKTRLSRKATDDVQARRILDRIAGSCRVIETRGPSRRGAMRENVA